MQKFIDREVLLYDFLPVRGHVAEVGVFIGDFSARILKVTNPYKLHLIDLWRKYDYTYDDPLNISDEWHEGNYNAVCTRFSTEVSNGIVEIHRADSVTAASSFSDEYFSFVYIDANHSYDSVIADLMAYAPKIKEDGFLAGHDYVNKLNFGVVDAVADFCRENDWEIAALTTDEWPSYALRRIE